MQILHELKVCIDCRILWLYNLSDWKGPIRITDEEVCFLLGLKERSRHIFKLDLCGLLCFPTFSCWFYELHDSLLTGDKKKKYVFQALKQFRQVICVLSGVCVNVCGCCMCMHVITVWSPHPPYPLCYYPPTVKNNLFRMALSIYQSLGTVECPFDRYTDTKIEEVLMTALDWRKSYDYLWNLCNLLMELPLCLIHFLYGQEFNTVHPHTFVLKG